MDWIIVTIRLFSVFFPPVSCIVFFLAGVWGFFELAGLDSSQDTTKLTTLLRFNDTVWKDAFHSCKVAEVSELQASCGEPSCPENPHGEDGGEGTEFCLKASSR